MIRKWLKRIPPRTRRGTVTVMAISSSGTPPKSVTIPLLAAKLVTPVLAIAVLFIVASYFSLTHGVIALNSARQSNQATIDELLQENHQLKQEKEARIAEIRELTGKTSRLATMVDQMATEKTQIWTLVQGKPPANSARTNSPSRGSLPGAERRTPDEGLLDIDDPVSYSDPTDNAIDEGELVRKADEEVGRLLDLAESMRSDMAKLKTSAESFKYKKDHTPSIYPVKGRITSAYGSRLHPILRVRLVHEGIDIAASKGTPIVATADGVVTKSGRSGGYGNIVEIQHGYGIITRYAHNTKNAVKVGAKVKQGQVIAYVGSTGLSTGPHVHYEVRVNGAHVNPASYLK